MKSEEEKRDRDKGKGKEAKCTRIFSVAMVIVLVLSVSVGILLASEVPKNGTYAGSEVEGSSLQNDTHAENENEKPYRIWLFPPKAMRNFTENVSRDNESRNINISDILHSKNETGVESGAGENIMTAASTDNESLSVKEETVPQYYSSYIDWGDIGGSDNWAIGLPSVGRTIAVVGKMYQYQKGVARAIGGNTTVVEEMDKNKTVVEIGENTTVVEETDGNATALSGPFYYPLARVIATEGWNNPTDVNRNEWAEFTMDYYDEDCTSPYTFEDSSRLKGRIWVEKITINVKPMPSDVDDIRGDYDYLIVASYFYGYNGATYSSAALDEIDEEISDTITYSEVKNNLYRGGMVYDERGKTIYLIGHAQDAVSPGYYDLNAAEQGITSINQEIQAPEKLDMDHKLSIPEPAYISIAKPPQPVMKRTEVKNYGGYHNFEVTFKDTYVTKPTVGTVPVSVLALVNQGLEFYLQSQAIHSFYLYEENYNFSVEYIPDNEILFEDDFERYSVGTDATDPEMEEKWTHSVIGDWGDVWEIGTATGHGNVLEFNHGEDYDPVYACLDCKNSDEWIDYTLSCEWRYADDYNEGDNPNTRGTGIIFRAEDGIDDCYLASFLMMDWDSGEERGSLDEDDYFYAVVANVYGDGTLIFTNSLSNPVEASGDVEVVDAVVFIDNEHDFGYKLLYNDWFHTQIGVEEDHITLHLDGILLINTEDEEHDEGPIGLYIYCPEDTPAYYEFDNVVVTKGCLFSDQFNSIDFTKNAWDLDYPYTYVDEDNGILVIDGTGADSNPEVQPEIEFGGDISMQADLNVTNVVAGQNAKAGAAVYQYLHTDEGAGFRRLEANLVVTDAASTYLEVYLSGGDGYITIPLNINLDSWHNMELRFDYYLPYGIDTWRYRGSVYIDGKLMWYQETDVYWDIDVIHESYLSVELETNYAKANFDNVYVEEIDEGIPPAVSITSPGGGDTVSGIVTVETTVNDAGGSGISHSALYVNDTLVAVNISSANPTFQFDTSLLPSGNYTLTLVAVDNAMNSNWAAITVDVNKLPVANFTYSPENPTTADTITFDASESYDPDGTITSYDWDFCEGNTSSGEIVTHRYTSTGTYMVNLTVTDDDGATDSTLKVITVAPPTSPWPMFHHDLKHTGLSPYDTSDNPGQLKWKYHIGNSVSSPAIDSDGTIYVGSCDHYVYAINFNGTLKWKFGTGGRVWSSPAIGKDGTIYVGSENGYIYAIYPNGTLRWEFDAQYFIGSSPTIGKDGIVYIGTQNSYVYAFYPNGTVKWEFDMGHMGKVYSSSPAIADDGTVYIGSESNKCLYAITPDGTLKWKYPTREYIYHSSPAIGSDGIVYIGSGEWDFDGYLYAIYPNGTLKWEYHTGSYLGSSPAIGSDDTIYVGSGNYLYAIYPNGTLRWNFGTNSIVSSSPAIGKDGTIFIGSYGNYVYAIHPDGALKWKFKTQDKIYYSSPAIGSDGTIYVCSYDDNLYAIGKGIFCPQHR